VLHRGRHYVVRRRRLQADGSVVLSGDFWPLPYFFLGLGGLASVVPRALGALMLLFEALELVNAGRWWAAGLVVALAPFLLWSPTRTVTFDRAQRLLRIRHGGLIRSYRSRELPLSLVRGVDFVHLETVQAHDVDLLTLTLADGERLELAAIFDGWDNRTLPDELEALRAYWTS
jgi:hypothetical protein